MKKGAVSIILASLMILALGAIVLPQVKKRALQLKIFPPSIKSG